MYFIFTIVSNIITLIITDKLLRITWRTTDLIQNLVRLLQRNYEYEMLTFFAHYRTQLKSR